MISSSKPNFYGRRAGRRLRKARAEAFEVGLKQYEILLPEEGLLDLSSLFPIPVRSIWLEIGFGNGEHLAAQAQRHPEIGFIGCEPFRNGVSALVQELERLDLNNVHIYPDDVRVLLKTVPDNGIDRCFVLFADPWPKKRHARRRVISHETLDELARVMPAGAPLFLATDDSGLAVWYRTLIAEHPRFELSAASGTDAQTRPIDWPATRYEQKALQAGRQPVYYHALRTE